MLKNIEDLEEQYYEELDASCDCDVVEEGCCCMSFEKWLEWKREEFDLACADY
jgi:hypothetical protein